MRGHSRTSNEVSRQISMEMNSKLDEIRQANRLHKPDAIKKSPFILQRPSTNKVGYWK